jgi:hypothetical protein
MDEDMIDLSRFPMVPLRDEFCLAQGLAPGTRIHLHDAVSREQRKLADQRFFVEPGGTFGNVIRWQNRGTKGATKREFGPALDQEIEVRQLLDRKGVPGIGATEPGQNAYFFNMEWHNGFSLQEVRPAPAHVGKLLIEPVSRHALLVASSCMPDEAKRLIRFTYGARPRPSDFLLPQMKADFAARTIGKLLPAYTAEMEEYDGRAAMRENVVVVSDTKPSHIMLRPDGTSTVIVDYGGVNFTKPEAAFSGLFCELHESHIEMLCGSYVAQGGQKIECRDVGLNRLARALEGVFNPRSGDADKQACLDDAYLAFSLLRRAKEKSVSASVPRALPDMRSYAADIEAMIG